MAPAESRRASRATARASRPRDTTKTSIGASADAGVSPSANCFSITRCRSSRAGPRRRDKLGKCDLALDAQVVGAVARRGLEHDISFRLRRAGNIASAARIVQCQFEHLAVRHLLKAHLRACPVERALDASQVEPNG